MRRHQNVLREKPLNTLMRASVGVDLNMLPYYFQVDASLTSK